jgi:hypothetical protein
LTFGEQQKANTGLLSAANTAHKREFEQKVAKVTKGDQGSAWRWMASHGKIPQASRLMFSEQQKANTGLLSAANTAHKKRI